MAEVWRDGKVNVRAEQCGNCLFSRDRLVSGERARQLTRDTRAEDGASFICHRSQVSPEEEAICATWFDRFAREDAILRLAVGMDLIEYIGP